MTSPVFELSRQFWFDAAHTLQRPYAADQENSRRIHGHSYRAEVTVRGPADPASGMVMDLGHLHAVLDKARLRLDHMFLDEIAGLGAPTMENLCQFIWQILSADLPQLYRVRVYRDSQGEVCTLTSPRAARDQ